MEDLYEKIKKRKKILLVALLLASQLLFIFVLFSKSTLDFDAVNDETINCTHEYANLTFLPFDEDYTMPEGTTYIIIDVNKELGLIEDVLYKNEDYYSEKHLYLPSEKRDYIFNNYTLFVNTFEEFKEAWLTYNEHPSSETRNIVIQKHSKFVEIYNEFSKLSGFNSYYY